MRLPVSLPFLYKSKVLETKQMLDFFFFLKKGQEYKGIYFIEFIDFHIFIYYLALHDKNFQTYESGENHRSPQVPVTQILDH